VYVIRSDRAGKIYIGHTQDLEKAPEGTQRPRVTFVEIYQTFPRSVGSGLF
jgi:predicted GIY-YIG superfamily endonuclease